jgi:nitroreductase
MELMEAVKNRRSVRRFTEDVVSDSDIREMIDAARWAPSWANTQVWEFIAVRDRGLIEKITATYSETNPARKCSLAATALIVACAKVRVSGCKEGRDVTEFGEWFMFDIGAAVQTLCLRAHELGLGTVIVGYLNHSECGRLLGLPDGMKPVVVIPVGRPAIAGREGPARRVVSEILHNGKFGAL